MNTSKDISLYTLPELLALNAMRSDFKAFESIKIEDVEAEIIKRQTGCMLIAEAEYQLKAGISEALLESKLYAKRTPSIGIKHIVYAIKKAKENLEVTK
mgnify:FL=1